MEQLTCIVVGAGYAGINAVKEIKKTLQNERSGRTLRLILIDKNLYHTRKVLLFKPAAITQNITIPLMEFFPSGVEFVQATVTQIDSDKKRLLCQDAKGNESTLTYDILVVAVGSVVRQTTAEQGGVALTNIHAASIIHEMWRANLVRVVKERSVHERQRLMTIAVTGAGISGIETSAELAHFVREEAKQLGLDPNAVKIILFNMNKRLFTEGPTKLGDKLAHILATHGVTVVHDSKVLKEKNGIVTLLGDKTIPVGLCIWTLGLLPNPMLRSIGLPVNDDGFVLVDASYRVQGAHSLYSIGDCARIVDPASGLVDGMTCKEASAQAARLGNIVLADLTGNPAPTHKRFMDFFCFGLGPEQGLVWTHKWGLDVIFTGKLGWRLRKWTWDIASLIK
ncbi:NAD(P)/FAD-dependent oxidoreductase [Paenibacillus sp. L3-i20]|uniref:NAD(P)/FAD-dependent oxidoreductase n=1 Tax=Paenibacillus sp. L3-i20 TaxID=2905833 RepID=UPI001EE0D932|nr:FAD-dependent oxidoreductase [Paenibacillus sp. L3-i20]GKU76428.1 hypothetical protein L3i20_v208250 [Paenibacillus sp. L3-i20]